VVICVHRAHVLPDHAIHCALGHTRIHDLQPSHQARPACDAHVFLPFQTSTRASESENGNVMESGSVRAKWSRVGAASRGTLLDRAQEGVHCLVTHRPRRACGQWWPEQDGELLGKVANGPYRPKTAEVTLSRKTLHVAPPE
jgi:hypothetical protein